LAQLLKLQNAPVKYFATTESHNTPRTKYLTPQQESANIVYWFLTMLLNQGIPYIHSGFELNETAPVNTGLGFTEKDLKKFPAEKLPLFSTAAMNWEEKSVIKAIHKLSEFLLERDLPGSSINALEELEEEIILQLETKLGDKYMLSISFEPFTISLYDKKYHLILSLPDDISCK
jgi:hypothetical protein